MYNENHVHFLQYIKIFQASLICIVNFYLFAKFLSISHARCIQKVYPNF